MKPGRPHKSVSGLGARLRLVRERLDLSQGAMAEDLRVTRSAISAWESGLRQLEGPALVAIEALYGVDRHWLLSGEGMLLCNQTGNQLSGVISCPVLEAVTAWDMEGRLHVPPAAEVRPLPEDEARGLLERSGGGTSKDLVFLKAPSGFPPSIPPDALILLNASESVRRSGGTLAMFLVRRRPDDPGVRLGSLERTSDGWVLGAPPGATWPPQPLPVDGEDLLPLVLGRVMGVWSPW